MKIINSIGYSWVDNLDAPMVGNPVLFVSYLLIVTMVPAIGKGQHPVNHMFDFIDVVSDSAI